jgi:CBS domain-containing protein
MEQTTEQTDSGGRADGARQMCARVQEFLRAHEPFSGMRPEALEFLAARLRLAFFPRDAEIAGPDDGVVRSVYILEQGRVRARQNTEMTVTEYAVLALAAGDCFPIGAAAAQRPSTNRYLALTDCYCYVLAVEDFQQLMELSPEFTVFCTRYIAALLNQSRQQLHLLFTQRASEQQSLNSPLQRIGTREPLCTMPDTPLREALATMSAARVGSIVLVNSERKPLGILTRSDLLDRVILAAKPLDVPVGEVMTESPVCLEEHASAYDAVMRMATHRIRHMLVVDREGRLTGLVSERDLFALQRIGLRQIRQAIETAPDIAALREAARDIRQLAFNMLGQGLGAEQQTQFISILNDALTHRIIELNLDIHDLYGIEWCWLAFGSEGRDEQTFSTDQDNGIVYLSDDFTDREALKQRLLEFARAVNEDLDRCGFPLCKGNIMASNPQWCLTLDEWETQFRDWVRKPHPESLLNASIFFDFRPLYGKLALAEQLRRFLLAETADASMFLRAMAVNALQVTPPLGKIRDFVIDLDPDHPGKIDLKKYGIRLFVDAARIYALASGVHNTNTVQRLRIAGARRSVNAEETEAIIEGLNFIQLLRLRHQQLDDRPGEQGNNLVAPDSLNELDRQILKEAFRQARKLQTRLKLDYQTG